MLKSIISLGTGIGSVMPAVRLRYNKRAFYPTFILLVVALAFFNLAFDLLISVDLLSGLVAAAVSIVFLVVIGLSPILTDHELTADTLTLRQGWMFRASIPLSEILKVTPVEKGPLRTGVFFDVLGTSLYVTTQRHSLLLLELQQRRRFTYALGKRANKVYFDTLDQTRFLSELERRRPTPASPAPRS
jgi:membrane protein YdbS with pleckstrin-like domain